MKPKKLEKIKKFMILSRAAASLSKDRSTKLGAIILGKGFEVKALGYNGFPRGVDDDVEARHERPLKYQFTEHAERNAIYNAARVGTPLQGSMLLLDSAIFVCTGCARAIINSGIKKVIIFRRMDYDKDRVARWAGEELISREMFKEAKVKVIEISELDEIEE